MSSKILFLRHGITEGNKNKWFYGALDLPLLDEGKAEITDRKTGESWKVEISELFEKF